MRKFGKNFISMVLSLALTVGILSAGAGSVKVCALSYSPSTTSYRNGPYYTKLTNVTLTGDQRRDIVEIAKSQIEYHEGSNSSDCSGNSSGSGDFTEYGTWYGSNTSWCAIFISWCAAVAGVPTNIIKRQASAASGSFNTANYYSFGSYTPQKGDILYLWNPYSNHVGLVKDVDDTWIYTIEGNMSNKVRECKYSKSTGKISWYNSDPQKIVSIGAPNYSSTHKLTVNYYSNYADQSFDNPLNSVGSNKNVIVRTAVFYSDQNVPDGFHNYTKPSNGTYLARTGYTGTGNWNTKPDGSGYSVDQNTAFANGKLMAQAVGKDISSADATVNLYPEWTINKLTINYYSNYADKSFEDSQNVVSSNANVLVRTAQYDYSTVVQYGVHDYSHEGDSTYLGRTGYMATGYWNTKADGSGYRIYEDERNVTGSQIAQTLGLSIANGNATVNLYPEWNANSLIVNYYSNYADKSFDDPLNAVSSDKNVLVKTTYFKYDMEHKYGLNDFSCEGDSAYLGRTGYTTTSNWNTKADGSGISISEATSFASGQALAQALGKDLSNGDVSINLYPEWIKEPDVPTEIVVKAGSGAYIDEDNGIIFGVEANLSEAQLIDRFIGVQGGNIEVSASSRRMGTGTVITLCDASGNELKSYCLVVFGDIDGNGIINSSDVVAANEGLAYGFEQDCFKTAANVSMTRRNDRFNATDVAALLEMIQNTGVDQTEIADTLAYYSGLV